MIYSGQQGDHYQQKIEWKLEFLGFLDAFQGYKEQRLDTIQIKWERELNLIPIQY